MTDVGERSDWRMALAGFVSDLGTGEDRVPLERVLRRHIAAFEAVLATGRTWPQIAQALTAAGARHKRGQPMAAKQLRTVYTRSLATRPEDRQAAMPFAPARSVAPDLPSDAGAATRSTTPARRALPVEPSLDAGHGRVMERLAEARKARAALRREFDE